MAEWPMLAVARKDLLLLARDRRSVLLLLALPGFFIAVLGVLLGEGFGTKADDRVRVSLVDLDRGTGILGSSFARLVRDDLLETPGIRVELLPGRAAMLPVSRSLLVADLHLGKAATFRKAGLPVPEGSAQRDLARLRGLVEATAARRL